MLTPSEYDHLCDRLIFLYDELDRSIIEDMTRRMMRMGYVSEATKWQAKQLQESGLLYEDILAEISKRTDATRNHVRTLFEDAGVQSIRNDNNRYRSAGLSGIVKMSDSALQTLNAGYIKCRGNLHNLTLTTANTAQQEYINACDLAYMQVTSGTMDYGTAIRRAVQSTASKGSWVLYPTGHRDRLDVAVRRSVLTGVGQTVRQLSAINANDMGCDLMEITAHAGARPSHAQWQGQIVSLSGRKGYLSPKDIGYGTGDGFGGWNCRHDWYPYFEGISERAYSEERLRELNARNIEVNGQKYTEYEASQIQRKLERKVREMKRRVLASETALKNAPDQITANQMQDFFASESAKLKKAEQKLKGFLNQTGNLPDSTRTWVNGFSRNTAQKAVHAGNKKFVQEMREKGIKNSPKSLAIFEKMKYTNPKEYDLMKAYIKSVDSGMMSPLVGFDKYKEYYERIENDIIGITAPDGTIIKSQSKHFLERVFGTIDDPSHEGVKRSGVEIDDIIDALKNGTIIHKKGNTQSVVFRTNKCEVSVNPQTGNLIQVTPK